MNKDRNALLRAIPKVDELLQDMERICPELPHAVLLDAVREELYALRSGALNGRVQELPQREALCEAICQRAQHSCMQSLRRVINATGVILHTNLGRAPLSDAAMRAAAEAGAHYSTLEYDVQEGQRGSRHAHVEHLLKELLGVEAAMVVNNNAAAVLLMLSALCAGREVAISRGELVEIGGAFRVPEIMEQSGCTLREVGTTNKTHESDYLAAITEQTAALLKVHTSNFAVIGFTESVSVRRMCEMAHERGILALHDLGSGALADPAQAGLVGEPTVMQSVQAGVDVVTFSGDKLLGGPQAGIAVGRRACIEAMKRHPLARALRVDKLTLSALCATLMEYRAQTHWQNVPVLRMMAEPAEQVQKRAQELCAMLEGCQGLKEIAVVQTRSQVGGGSLPGQELMSYAVRIAPAMGAAQAERALRIQQPPIVARIAQDHLLLDLRTVADCELCELAEGVKRALSAER